MPLRKPLAHNGARKCTRADKRTGGEPLAYLDGGILGAAAISGRWQLNMDGETGVGVRGGPHAAAVDLDDRTADGEPHPQSVRLGADEVPEDLLQLGLGHADARVRDLDDHVSGWLRMGPNRDHAGAAAA